jgi:hypothetical protein
VANVYAIDRSPDKFDGSLLRPAASSSLRLFDQIQHLEREVLAPFGLILVRRKGGQISSAGLPSWSFVAVEDRPRDEAELRLDQGQL